MSVAAATASAPRDAPPAGAEGGVSPLAGAVRERARARQITLKAAAAEMGLTYSHLMALCNGQRRFGGVRRDRMERIAAFLGVSVVHCYLLAGAFTAADFVGGRDLPRRLDLTLAKLQVDPEWSAFAPALRDWAAWPQEARLLVCLLYERDGLDHLRRHLRGRR